LFINQAELIFLSANICFDNWSMRIFEFGAKISFFPTGENKFRADKQVLRQQDTASTSTQVINKHPSFNSSHLLERKP
jgi:hypothetical protein